MVCYGIMVGSFPMNYGVEDVTICCVCVCSFAMNYVLISRVENETMCCACCFPMNYVLLVMTICC